MDLLSSMQVFVRAVDGGSLSAAAEACGMSATMAGNHLRALEKRTGMKLLNRTTRRQSLTEFGETYYVRCQEILRLVGDADTHAENRHTVPSGKLRVTAPVSFGSEVLVPALADYLADHPQVEIDLSLSDHTVDLFEQGFDVGFRVGTMADTALVARALMPYRVMICASPDYLAKHGTPTHPDELSAHECLAFSHTRDAPWRLAHPDGVTHVTVKGRLRINHGQALRVAARCGQGIVMQPAVLLQADVDAGHLVQLFPDYALPQRPMHLVYLPDHRSPKLRSFVDFALVRFAA